MCYDWNTDLGSGSPAVCHWIGLCIGNMPRKEQEDTMLVSDFRLNVSCVWARDGMQQQFNQVIKMIGSGHNESISKRRVSSVDLPAPA